MDAETSLLTQYRLALAEHIGTDLEIPMIPGRIEGPIEEGILGCTYPDVEEEVPDRVMEGIIRLGVRILVAPPIEEQIEPTSPPDPSVLEFLSQRLQLSVKNHQTQLGPWYQRVTRVAYDLDAWMLDAEVLAYTDNLAV